MEYSTTTRTCFIEEEEEEEEEDGVASLADMEAGLWGNHYHHNHSVSRPLIYYSQRRSSLRNLSFSSVSSPRSGMFFDTRFEEHHHHQPYFLDACSLCKKPLGDNRDIFMYRGDTPFCSEECRQEEIEIDEAREKSSNLSASMKAIRKKDQNKSKPNSPNKTTPDYHIRSSTVAAA